MDADDMDDLQKLLDAATPGPWRVEQETTLIWGSCNLNDTSNWGMGYPVAQCRISPISSWAKGPDIDAGEANARLTSLAPDLARRVIAADRLIRELLAWAPPEEQARHQAEWESFA